MAALRLVSGKRDYRVGNFNVESCESRGNAERTRCLEGMVSSPEKVLTSTRGSCRFESVTQNLETAKTDVVQLRLDERSSSCMVFININGMSHEDYVVRRLGTGKTGLWRFEESMVNVPQGFKNQEWEILSNIRIQKLLAQPSELQQPCPI
jgi:hypothetical protein